jgi:ABC-type transport system substrate-binding protein
MAFGTVIGGVTRPWQSIAAMTTGDSQNTTYNDDDTYDAMYMEIVNAATEAEARELTVQADMYALEQCWTVNLFPTAVPVLAQPYLKGYSGEYAPNVFYFSRWWVERSLKEAMGH